jgi:conserved oligomeric Golgi complex subunit 4
LADGIQVVFNNVIKHRLRPILADAFRDIEYEPRDAGKPTSTDHSHDPDHGRSGGSDDDSDEALRAELVRPRFASAWNELMLPMSRILTANAFDRLLAVTLAYLARLLEKRLWAYHARINQLGAFRLERDVSGVVNAAVDVSGSGAGGPRTSGRYRHRDVFARCVQVTMVMAMEDDEWEEMVRTGEDAAVFEKLSVEERMRARAMVRT